MKGLKTGGRARGTPNRATADIKALCQDHTEAAITELARLSLEAVSEPARVAAIKELLDRGYGRAAQLVELTGEIQHTHVARLPSPSPEIDQWRDQQRTALPRPQTQ